MKFDLSAAKAYVGGVLAVAGEPVAHFLIGLVEKGLGIDIPVNLEAFVIMGATYALGHTGVYFTKNAAVPA